MLKRIYIDNYKSLVNVELALNEINLFLGANGSGKSAVFEILRAVQDFICAGERTSNVFHAPSLTRWQKLPVQTFELELDGNPGLYKYELEIEYQESRSKVKREYLLLDDQPLLKLEKDGEVSLYRDDHSRGSQFPIDQTLSAVGAIPPRPNNIHLTWFRERLGRFIVAQIMPPLMSGQSLREDSRLSPHMENFVSWYRYLSQDQGLAFQLTSELKEIMPGFNSFKFGQAGKEQRLLQVCFETDAKAVTSYDFDELSDGQRMLIALYTLLHVAHVDQGVTLCLDEPGNFVALPEIQPWLIRLYDSCAAGQMQALLISHHPEPIDYLLASPVGYWFERQDNNRPTRIKPITADGQDGLPISEIVARGWLHE